MGLKYNRIGPQLYLKRQFLQDRQNPRALINIRIIVAFILLFCIVSSAAAEDHAIDIAPLKGQYAPAIVETPISTEIPGTTVVKVRLPFPGSASFGSAICQYVAANSTIPRILLHCGEIIPQGYQSLKVESIFLGADGTPGIPAKRAQNGSLYTERAGQTGKLFVSQLHGIVR